MKKKIFVILIICCVLVPVSIFSAYSLGARNSYYIGFDAGYAASKEYEQQWRNNNYVEGYQSGFFSGNQTGYLTGFQVAQNSTIP
jgi:uncharacterized protein YxeA